LGLDWRRGKPSSRPDIPHLSRIALLNERRASPKHPARHFVRRETDEPANRLDEADDDRTEEAGRAAEATLPRQAQDGATTTSFESATKYVSP
jgi:hypothetical protein